MHCYRCHFLLIILLIIIITSKKSTANLQFMVNSNRGRITYGLRIAGYFRV